MVTGSSMFRALGLDTLKAEKEHFNVHVRKLPSTLLSTDVQEYIKFGSENEINATSTLIGSLMPTLSPPCHAFFEVGPKFIHGVHKKDFIEVSGDGIIQCTKGDACERKNRIQEGIKGLQLKQRVYFHLKTCLNSHTTNYQLDMFHNAFQKL